MKRKLTFPALISAAVLALGASPVLAQNAYGDWDTNADAGIDQQEWNTGWGQNGVFDRFDANSDGMLSKDEFNEGLGTNSTGSVGTAGSTFNDRFGETAYNDWDADGDGNLSEDEFNEGVYAGYDQDDSGVIEEPEFGDYGDDIGDGGFWDV